jgi:XTP/dITP diphosphohydrolase
MIEKLVFATTNHGKVEEARAILEIPIEIAKIEVDEVQNEDVEYVARRKVEAVFEKVQQPVFVDDVSVELESWNGLPGAYVKSWLEKLTLKGILERLQYEKNRNLVVKSAIGYHDGKESMVFVGEVHGTLAYEERGKEGFGFDFSIIPEGQNLTYAEMGSEAKNRLSHRRKALDKFRDYLESQGK